MKRKGKGKGKETERDRTKKAKGKGKENERKRNRKGNEKGKEKGQEKERRIKRKSKGRDRKKERERKGRGKGKKGQCLTRTIFDAKSYHFRYRFVVVRESCVWLSRTLDFKSLDTDHLTYSQRYRFFPLIIFRVKAKNGSWWIMED